MGCGASSAAPTASDEPPQNAPAKVDVSAGSAQPVEAERTEAGVEWAASGRVLTDAEMALVQKLFDVCDKADGHEGDGIDLFALSQMETEVGPHKVEICSELADADVTDDGVVTLAELTRYFTKGARLLTENELTLVLADLIEKAQGVKPTALAMRDLTDAEQALVTQLYGLCDRADGHEGDGIDLNKLAEVDMSIGPLAVKPMAQLKDADVSKDGIVTLPELNDYFRKAARKLDETELSELLNDLVSSVKGTSA